VGLSNINDEVIQNPFEKVFNCTSRKPIETTTSFPESHLNSKNSLSLFLASDQTKLKVLDNFKQLNRDLTQAFLQSSDPNKPAKKQPK
jgi:hypothetical protein